VLDDADVAAGALDDDALDDDELDPHPAITAAIMATATTPALMRARLDLIIGPTPPLDLPAGRSALTLRPARRKQSGSVSLQQAPPAERLRV
jgi:hypothetical protein